ncbi:cupin [Flammeovirgaceae bacterium 311]|nr:cupin [Flammeovirgaceae bacterium 311]
MQTSNILENVIVGVAKEYRSYMGGFYKIIISAEQSGGSFALLDMTLPRGVEPPRHVHTREDESFYLLEGEISFHIGEKEILAQAGQAVFAPRLVEHHFNIKTETARFLTFISPGNFASYFQEFSVPAENLAVVPPQGPPPVEFLQYMTARLATEFGVQFI